MKCFRCKQTKPATDFLWRTDRRKRQTVCHECQRRYCREHYRQHKADYLARNRRKEALIRQLINDAKARPCLDCGKQYPHYVMDLDHCRGTKRMIVSRAIHTHSLKLARAEIEKCDVVCANCHRERTFQKWVKAHSKSAGRESNPHKPCKGLTLIRRGF